MNLLFAKPIKVNEENFQEVQKMFFFWSQYLVTL